jgi:hypothetical protein
MDNPEKLGRYGTEDEVKKNKKHHNIHAYHKQRKQDMYPPTNN